LTAEDRANVIGNTAENLVKFCRVVFEMCERTHRQTNRQTDTLITILRRPAGDEITIAVCLYCWQISTTVTRGSKD